MPYQQNYQGGYAQTYPCQEMARSVLWMQPPPPRTVPIHFVDTEYSNFGRDIVPMKPYAVNLTYDLYDPQMELANVSKY